MAEKLSKSLEKLAEKTKSLEENILKARKETKDKLTNRIEELKTELQVKKEKFIAASDKVDARVEDDLNSFQTSIRQKAEHLKSETQSKRKHIHEMHEQKKHERNIATAERHYNTSVDIAETCIEWALISLAEVETAILEVYAAKIKVEDLKAAQLEITNKN